MTLKTHNTVHCGYKVRGIGNSDQLQIHTAYNGSKVNPRGIKKMNVLRGFKALILHQNKNATIQ